MQTPEDYDNETEDSYIEDDYYIISDDSYGYNEYNYQFLLEQLEHVKRMAAKETDEERQIRLEKEAQEKADEEYARRKQREIIRQEQQLLDEERDRKKLERKERQREEEEEAYAESISKLSPRMRKLQKQRIKEIRERQRKTRQAKAIQKEIDIVMTRHVEKLAIAEKEQKEADKQEIIPDDDEDMASIKTNPDYGHRREQPPVIDTDDTESRRSEASDKSRRRAPKKVTLAAPILKPSVLSQPLEKRVEVKTPQQDQLQQKELMVETQTSSITQQQLLLNLYNQMKPTKEEVSDEQYQHMEDILSIIKASLSQQSAIINKQQQEIEHSKQVATYYSPKLKLPQLYEYTDMNIPGTREALQAKNIRAAIETFNPDKNPEQDFANTWRQILLYTQNYKLDSKTYINILTIIVQGSASHTLYEMSTNDKDITQILTTMGNLYSKRRTIVDDMHDLNNFKRKPNEHIQTAMQRAQIMAERVRHLWPDTVWEQTKRLELLLSILRQIVSEATKKHLDFEEMKYWKAGTVLEYEALLDIVETYEHVNNEIPTKATDLTINICTNTPKPVTSTNEKTEPIHNTEHIGNKKLQQIIANVARLNQTLGINNVEPMDTAYKPTVSFPPKSDTNTSTWKKRRIDDGTQPKLAKNPFFTKKPPLAAKRTHDQAKPTPKPTQTQEASKTATQETPFTQTYEPRTPLPEKPKNPTYHSDWQAHKPTWPPKQTTTQKGPAAISQEKEISLDAKKSETYKQGYYNKEYQKPYGEYQRDYTKTYGERYSNNYPQYGGYRRPYYRGGGYYGNRGYSRGYNRGYNRNYNNYNRGYGYGRRGYNSGYYNRGSYYDYKTNTKETKEPKDYRCPSCKALHKISTFCPNTGSMVVNENQLSLNYEGSRQSLPTRTLQRFE
jgi:hypothetical protein